MIRDLETFKFVTKINSKEKLQIDYRIIQSKEENGKMDELDNSQIENFEFDKENIEKKPSKLITSENFQKKIILAQVYLKGKFSFDL